MIPLQLGSNMQSSLGPVKWINVDQVATMTTKQSWNRSMSILTSHWHLLSLAVSNLSVSLDISSPNPSGRCLSIWPVQQRGMRQLHSFLPSRFLPVAVWNFISKNISKHGWHHVTPHSPNICNMDFQTFTDYNILYSLSQWTLRIKV